MATPEPTEVLRNGGKLIKDPTNLAIVSPYGGTRLGITGKVMVQPMVMTSTLMGGDDQHAHQTVEALYLGESWILGVPFRQWEDDIKQVVFANTIVGGSSGTRVVQKLGTSPVKAGSRLSNKGMKLLFEPDDPSNPFILFYRVLPLLEETAELLSTAIDEMIMPILFHAIPDASGRVYQMGYLADLSLTP